MSLNQTEITYLLSEERVEAVRQAWERFDLKLGLPGIDKQHLWLLAILLDLESLLNEQRDTKSKLPLKDFYRGFQRLLEELIDYTIEHFALEEEFLRHIHYQSFTAHKREHTRFIAGLRMRLKGLQSTDEAALMAGAEKLLQSLKRWLMHHILSEDRAYSNEFMPDGKNPEQRAAECESILKELGVNIRFEQERLYRLVQKGEKPNDEPAPFAQPAGYSNENNIIRWVAGLWHAYRLQIGVPIIDMQHLWLIKLIAELEAAERDREFRPEGDEETQKRFQNAVAELQNYVAEHFSTEEAIMREFNFPGLPGHIRQHENFVESVSQRIAEAEAGNTRALNHLVRDLKQWLIAHIAVEDRRIYYFLRQRLDSVNEFVRKLAAEKRLTLRHGYLDLYNEIVHFRSRK